MVDWLGGICAGGQHRTGKVPMADHSGAEWLGVRFADPCDQQRGLKQKEAHLGGTNTHLNGTQANQYRWPGPRKNDCLVVKSECRAGCTVQTKGPSLGFFVPNVSNGWLWSQRISKGRPGSWWMKEHTLSAVAIPFEKLSRSLASHGRKRGR